MSKKKGKKESSKKPERFPKSENDPKEIHGRFAKAVKGARSSFKSKAWEQLAVRGSLALDLKLRLAYEDVEGYVPDCRDYDLLNWALRKKIVKDRRIKEIYGLRDAYLHNSRKFDQLDKVYVKATYKYLVEPLFKGGD